MSARTTRALARAMATVATRTTALFRTTPGTTDYNALSNRPTLGTAAAQNVGAFATAAQGVDARTPTAHTHGNADLTGLAASLAGKSDTGHTHTIANVTNLQASLDGKAASSHTHAPSDITGTAVVTADARLSDARTPVAHNQAASTISDSTAAGRTLLTAADLAAQRTTLGITNLIPTVAATSATTGTMTVAMGEGARTITPTGDCTFNASGGVAGQTCTFIISTTASSRTLTFGTNFRKSATLVTGSVNPRFFSVTFICVADNGAWQEVSRSVVLT